MYKFADIPTEILAIIIEFSEPRDRISVAMTTSLDYGLITKKYPELFKYAVKLELVNRDYYNKYGHHGIKLCVPTILHELSISNIDLEITIPSVIEFIRNAYIANVYDGVDLNSIPIENLTLENSCSIENLNTKYVRRLTLIDYPVHYKYRPWPNVTHLTITGKKSHPSKRKFLDFTKFPKLRYLDIEGVGRMHETDKSLFGYLYNGNRLRTANYRIDTCKMQFSPGMVEKIKAYDRCDIQHDGNGRIITYKNAFFRGIKFNNLIIFIRY